MSTSSDPYARNSERALRTSLQPPREYLIPGGPYAANLGDVSVYKLAEIERGGQYDVAR